MRILVAAAIAIAATAGTAHADRVATPTFTGGIVTTTDGTKLDLQTGPCSFGEGDGPFVTPIKGMNAKATGCWTQSGHIIVINGYAVYTKNGILPARFELIADVPDEYYR